MRTPVLFRLRALARRAAMPVARRACGLVGMLAASAGCGVGTLAAQGTIRGALFDSLRTSRPIQGAVVVLLGADRRATTDQRGRFEFADVPDGPAKVVHWSPWLDSLALPPLEAATVVRAGSVVDVRLGPPSRASYERAVCGATFGPTDGILLGEVRGVDGQALGGVAVGARWHETILGVRQMERRQRATLDTTNANGFYTLCGVPTDAEFAVIAGSDSVATGEIVLSLGAAHIMRRDLIAGPDRDVGRVRGRVLGPDLKPVAGVTVAIGGDTARSTRTDEEGRFTLTDVPRRSTQFVARAIGFQPARPTRDLLEPDNDLEDLMLERLPQELSTVTVTATGEPLTANRLQFDERAKKGMGYFINDSTLARMPVVNSTLVSMLAPRTAIQQTRRGPMLMMRRGAVFCRPRFFVDGYDNGNIPVEEEALLMSMAKRIEIYTANFTPPRFNDFDGCGVVVIWTK